MLSLPEPERGGSLDLLRNFINAPTEEIWVLDLAWLVGSANPSGPYFIDITYGDEGSGKSFKQAVKRAVIDPSSALLGSPPRTARDLAIAGANSYVLTYNNLSKLSECVSDAICRFSTGEGWRCRQLFTDLSEVILHYSRPQMLNGISFALPRNDLPDRALIQNLPAIPKKKRLREKKLWAEFHKDHPKILGALLDAVVSALKNYDRVKIAAPERMADAQHWIVSSEEGLGLEVGTFQRVYAKNRAESVQNTIEGDIIASAIRDLMRQRKRWIGTASKLLGKLSKDVVDEKISNNVRIWPTTPSVLSRRLKDSRKALAQIGIEIEFLINYSPRKIEIIKKATHKEKKRDNTLF